MLDVERAGVQGSAIEEHGGFGGAVPLERDGSAELRTRLAGLRGD